MDRIDRQIEAQRVYTETFINGGFTHPEQDYKVWVPDEGKAFGRFTVAVGGSCRPGQCFVQLEYSLKADKRWHLLSVAALPNMHLDRFAAACAVPRKEQQLPEEVHTTDLRIGDNVALAFDPEQCATVISLSFDFRVSRCRVELLPAGLLYTEDNVIHRLVHTDTTWLRGEQNVDAFN